MRWLERQISLVLLRGTKMTMMILAIIGLYALGELGSLLAEWLTEAPRTTSERAIEAEGRQVTVSILISAAFAVYAFQRVFSFHPALTPTADYSKWLVLTPYRRGNRLPIGPVNPVWQDLLVLAPLFVVLLWRGAPAFWIPLVILACVYVLTATLAFSATKLRGPAYFNVFAVTLAILFHPWPVLVGALLVAAVVVTWAAVNVSVDRAIRTACSNQRPWEDLTELFKANANSEIESSTSPFLKSANKLGLPYATLSPQRKEIGFHRVDGVLLSIWFGLLFLCGTQHLVQDANDAQATHYVTWFGVITGIVIRGYVYLPGHHAPISLLGRFTTGKFIVPGYDRFFVAPIFAILITLLAPSFVPAHTTAFILTEPATLTAALLCLCFVGPTYTNWDITGARRLQQSPAMGSNNLTSNASHR